MAEITIRVREQIPYTSEFCEATRRISHQVFHEAEFDIAGETIRELLKEVFQCVDSRSQNES